MDKVKLIIECQTDDGVVHAIVNGVKYIYSGMDSAVFKVRQKTYKYKPGQLLNWLKRNSKKVEKVEDKPKPTTRVRVTNAHRVVMIGKTKNLMKENNYVPIMKGKTVEPKRCPKCKRMSLMGCTSGSKKAIIGICIHRFDPVEERRCHFNKRWDIDDSPKFTANAV